MHARAVFDVVKRRGAKDDQKKRRGAHHDVLLRVVVKKLIPLLIDRRRAVKGLQVSRVSLNLLKGFAPFGERGRIGRLRRLLEVRAKCSHLRRILLLRHLLQLQKEGFVVHVLDGVGFAVRAREQKNPQNKREQHKPDALKAQVLVGLVQEQKAVGPAASRAPGKFRQKPLRRPLPNAHADAPRNAADNRRNAEDARYKKHRRPDFPLAHRRSEHVDVAVAPEPLGHIGKCHHIHPAKLRQIR